MGAGTRQPDRPMAVTWTRSYILCDERANNWGSTIGWRCTRLRSEFFDCEKEEQCDSMTTNGLAKE
eukprot:4609841-Lingulodinium_polyedra.AAC.1